MVFPEFPLHSAVALMIFKADYLYCLKHSMRYLYTGTSTAIFSYLKSLAPFERVSEVKRMADGTPIAVGLLDWREFELKCNPCLQSFFLNHAELGSDVDHLFTASSL